MPLRGGILLLPSPIVNGIREKGRKVSSSVLGAWSLIGQAGDVSSPHLSQ